MYFHTALLFTNLTEDHDDITFEQLLWNVGFLALRFNIQFIELFIVGVVILKSKLPFLDFKSVFICCSY